MMKATKKIITLMVCVLFLTSIFHMVSAEEPVYTIEDNNSTITIKSVEKIIISLTNTGMYKWEIYSYEPSVLKFVDLGGWVHGDAPGSPATYNWTFEGKHKGNTTISFVYWDYWVGNASIRDNFTLYVNVTSNAPMSLVWKTIIVISIIIVVPTAIILKWMKGGKDK